MFRILVEKAEAYLAPTTVLMDFELAAIKAATAVFFGEDVVKSCLFHFFFFFFFFVF